jgi:alkylation response protein AidB-like acyl-CoA dehydrogenase
MPTDHERGMLRDSLRSFLEEHWPVGEALERPSDAEAIESIWRGLEDQGIADICTDPAEGGLREVCVVMDELGRAGCPAPMIGAALANLAQWDHDSSSRPCFVFDVETGAGGADDVVLIDGRMTGVVRFAEEAGSATHLVVALDKRSFAVVDLSEQSITVLPARAVGTHGLFEVRLEAVRVNHFTVPSFTKDELAAVARLCAAARAHGAARRAFELAVEYAKERHQFGRPIGSFQAIQHKLATCLINLEGVRRVIENAALSFDSGSSDWRYYAAAAFAFASHALRNVSLETHHVFGAIGYAEEHEAPRHFRRVHIDSLSHGGTRPAREELAAALLDRDESRVPTYDLGETGNLFRQDVTAWLQRNWSGERKAASDQLPYWDREFDALFALELGKTGWIGVAWPEAYGGQERSVIEQIAFMEEMVRADAPRYGAPIQANALMTFGTASQQARYLPEILRGEVMLGIGYSEPGSGSDLASLRTKAVKEGGDWVINGQKIWTTTYWGKYIFLAARTDPAATRPHRGISTFIFPLDTPGITIRPSKTMYDGTFANIFFDDVRIPSDALLGKENGGWEVLTNALATERGLVGGGIVFKVTYLFEMLCKQVREIRRGNAPLASDALVRDRLGALAAEIEVGRQLMMLSAESVVDGITPPELGAIGKVFCSELLERFSETALDILGMRGALSQGAPGAISNGAFEHGLRHSLMWIISMGTNEIQRSLIAQKALGLPR